MLEEYIASLGLNLDKEKAIKILCSAVGKAPYTGAEIFEDLIWAWEEWQQAPIRMGRNPEATNKIIEALAALRV